MTAVVVQKQIRSPVQQPCRRIPSAYLSDETNQKNASSETATPPGDTGVSRAPDLVRPIRLVRSEPVTDASTPDLPERRRAAAVAGHSGDLAGALRASLDLHPSVRSLGYGALLRLDELTVERSLLGLADVDTLVVRRVTECVARQPADAAIDQALLSLLANGPDVVAEVAAWALGERHQAAEGDDNQENGNDADIAAPTNLLIVSALSTAATSHEDALVRESAAAALGAIGHHDGLAAILHATTDKATVRRRAVLALASFDGEEVTAALQRARLDRDWQVRQAAEDLLS